MWCSHIHTVHAHVTHVRDAPAAATNNWVPELSSLADAVISRCAKVLATSVDELQRNYEEETSSCAKVSQKFTVTLLEYCCFKALHTATRNSSFLKDKQFRHLSFEMMLAWETPDSVVVCFKKFETERGNRERNVDEDLLYSTLIPLVVHQRSTIGKEAFVRIAPAILGVADVFSAQFQFDALSRSTGGRLPFCVYDKYLIELDKALDKLRHQRSFHNSFFLVKGEKVVEIDGTRESAQVIQHVGDFTQPGRLILTDYSLYFEPAVGLMAYDTVQKWDLTADLQQIVEPCVVGPWTLPFFNRALSYKSASIDEDVILEFPEFLGHSRRDYWLLIIQEILYTHQFIRNSMLDGAGQVEALSRSIMSIIRLKAVKEALRANPPQPKLLLCFSMVYNWPGGKILLRFLVDKLKKESLANSQGKTLSGRSSYAKSATYALYNSKTSYPKRKRVADDGRYPVGEFFLDEIPHIASTILKASLILSPKNGYEIVVCGEKADNLSVNFAIIKVKACDILSCVWHIP